MDHAHARSTPEQRNRYSRHLLLPEVGEEGQQKLLEREGAAARRRRPRLARRALPRGRRRRHARHRRHGRRRRVEPAAPDPAQHGPHRRAQGRLGEEDAHRAQPRRQRRHLRRAPRRRQRARHHRRLRRHRRRHRQLPDALPAQRRVAAEAHPRRARLDLPLRGPGHGVQPVRRPVLPLPAARAAAAGARAVVRGGRRARRAARHHRLDPGARGDQAAPRPRRPARRPAARLRRARGVVPHLQGAARPRTARRAATTPAEIVIAEYDELCMPHRAH